MAKSKEHKKAAIKPFMVKNYMSVFVNCMIENPAFDSQVTTLATPQHQNRMIILLKCTHWCFDFAVLAPRSRECPFLLCAADMIMSLL